MLGTSLTLVLHMGSVIESVDGVAQTLQICPLVSFSAAEPWSELSPEPSESVLPGSLLPLLSLLAHAPFHRANFPKPKYNQVTIPSNFPRLLGKRKILKLAHKVLWPPAPTLPASHVLQEPPPCFHVPATPALPRGPSEEPCFLIPQALCTCCSLEQKDQSLTTHLGPFYPSNFNSSIPPVASRYQKRLCPVSYPQSCSLFIPL